MDLPGAELVESGIADLAAGRETVEALLVASAAERLAEVGRPVPVLGDDDMPARLYALVEATAGDAHAHSQYNALRRRLVSYLRSASLERDATATGR
jgi:hypothetical protein